MSVLVTRKMIFCHVVSLVSCFTIINGLALCFKHLVANFPWLNEIDTLLLGLWKVFHYSALNRHIFSQLQEACGMKVLQLLKAAVTRWLSHGAACKRCRERYEQIIKVLDDTLVKNRNAEWIGYRSSLLKPATVFQITFLDDFFRLPINYVFCFRATRKILKQFPELLIQRS